MKMLIFDSDNCSISDNLLRNFYFKTMIINFIQSNNRTLISLTMNFLYEITKSDMDDSAVMVGFMCSKSEDNPSIV